MRRNKESTTQTKRKKRKYFVTFKLLMTKIKTANKSIDFFLLIFAKPTHTRLYN